MFSNLNCVQFLIINNVNRKCYGCIFNVTKCRHVICYWIHLAACPRFSKLLFSLPTTYTSKPRVAPSFVYLWIQKSNISSLYPYPSLVKPAPKRYKIQFGGKDPYSTCKNTGISEASGIKLGASYLGLLFLISYGTFS